MPRSTGSRSCCCTWPRGASARTSRASPAVEARDEGPAAPSRLRAVPGSGRRGKSAGFRRPGPGTLCHGSGGGDHDDHGRTADEVPAHRRATRSVRDLPAAERPRERLALRGPGGLSAAELIAVILGTGGAVAARWRSPRTLVARHAGLGSPRAGFGRELAGDPGRRRREGGPACGRVRARPAVRRGLARRPLDDPVAAGRRRPAGGRDGPARARGAARPEPQREERRAAGLDRLRRQRVDVAGPRRASCSGTPSGSTRRASCSSTTTRRATRRPARTTSTSPPRRSRPGACWTSTSSTTWSSATTPGCRSGTGASRSTVATPTRTR